MYKMETIDINTVKGIVYKVTNKTNNKVYIGQTLTHMYRNDKWYPTGATYRWACHITSVASNLKRSKTSFHTDLLILGPDEFEMKVIERCEVKVLNNREQHYIVLNDSMTPNGYNCTFGTSEINVTKEKVLSERGELIPTIKLDKPLLKKYNGQITLNKGVDKITFLRTKDIESIDICPIKRDGEYDSIRVLVGIADVEKRYRFQFGKKPLQTVAFPEVMLMMADLEVPKELIKIHSSLRAWLDDEDEEFKHFPEVCKLYEGYEITRITISPHHQNGSDYIRVIVHRVGDDKQKEMKRHVLGKKAECTKITYKRVMGLVSQLQEMNNQSIYIIDKCSQV